MTQLEKFIEAYSENLQRMTYDSELKSFIENNSYNSQTKNFDDDLDWEIYNKYAGRIVDPFYSDVSEDFLNIDSNDDDVSEALDILSENNLIDGMNKLGITGYSESNVKDLIRLIEKLGY